MGPRRDALALDVAPGPRRRGPRIRAYGEEVPFVATDRPLGELHVWDGRAGGAVCSPGRRARGGADLASQYPILRARALR